MRPDEIARITRGYAEGSLVPVALHLDHGDSIERVKQCLSGGYTSVMLDWSARPYQENVAALRQVSQLAHPLGVSVEGELGHVGAVGAVTAEGGGASTLTDPREAAAYVVETEVDALAVSIGNAHGAYTRLPRLDFERLADVRAATGVPLVLHGGSGTPDEDLQQAISLGVAKVNVATDVVSAYRESLRRQWEAGRNLWAPRALAEAMPAVARVVEQWIRRTGARSV